MAGHSKWANIKHRKAGQDAKRGKIFTKIIREITVAAKLGGGNPADNPRLRAVMDKALGANMTRDTIDRAIARGAGTAENENLEELVYEGYGPGGVAILCETLTDNKNRTVAEVRHGFSKFGGSMGTSGSVAYLFERTGVINFVSGADEEAIMESALDAGAHDVVSNEDGSIEVCTTLETFGPTQDALRAAGLEPERAEMTMIASTEVELDLDGAEKMLKLVEHLEDLDDVQNVYSNANISDEIAEQL
ncbi:MAG TPA: YebC/PmpR family DNA-binding transcriptional regulator [Gammaproteobacteria bacterium]|jgi:YebC/PmpR family DNA-binding regulatory protein|nr:YebC/PmpR family DNA-binding transcriptional regulator [Gammaproteobacteria bacterium]OUX33517.1 MAG: YebC/PmpR family DNA-binding transcriptional regulator [Gammaproteobacteria bacterium TMED260]RPG46741.1 MAG: YebC/PmpR family DNA-binding transcriptional regulator [Gammaproteobacteria bacterium TMED163]HAO88550.1 YebC/PmpR family DNA-binding transcriptional regulator [Gammaproteobacteria bacterium]HAR91211.1 YebC/PmpR family DNA-binding transcriptional regulator [Gammaproteobacteria bacter|tara:strand:+ start:2762 stop:3505 length:744 start_codon:yes stop_codon:yes gene_type:complete